MPDGLTLAAYLANRKGYLHVLDLRWQPSGESAPFAVVRVGQLLYAAAANRDVALVGVAPGTATHPVEILLEGGLYVRGGVVLGPRQRLSDYLESAGGFVPVVGAELQRSGRPPRSHNVLWGDIVVNQDAVQAVWDGVSRGALPPDRARVTQAVVDEPLDAPRLVIDPQGGVAGTGHLGGGVHDPSEELIQVVLGSQGERRPQQDLQASGGIVATLGLLCARHSVGDDTGIACLTGGSVVHRRTDPGTSRMFWPRPPHIMEIEDRTRRKKGRRC